MVNSVLFIMYEEQNFKEKSLALTANIFLNLIDILTAKSFRLLKEIQPIIINNEQKYCWKMKLNSLFLKDSDFIIGK